MTFDTIEEAVEEALEFYHLYVYQAPAGYYFCARGEWPTCTLVWQPI